MSDIVIGGDVHLDLARLVETRLLIQANSGGGKTWLLRRLLEQTHGKVQHLVIDPEGEFASLRERFDYVLAARSGGDTLADPRAARLLAEKLLELNASAILDIYELKAHDRVRFVRYFLEALVDAPKKLWHSALVVVDEAHVYCPEKGQAESAGAVIDLATRGRKRGFCPILATQRLAKLHKDAAAEMNNKLIGRTGLDIDVERAAQELGFGRTRWADLRSLGEGEFFAYGPAISRVVVPVTVGPVRTTHPKAGARLAFTAPPPTEKIKALLPKLADLPAEAEQRQRTMDELQRDVVSLKRQLREAVAIKPAAAPKVEAREVSILKDAHARRLDAACERLNELTAMALRVQGDYVDKLSQRMQVVVAEAGMLREQIRVAIGAAVQATRPAASSAVAQAGSAHRAAEVAGSGRPAMASRAGPVVSRVPAEGLSGPEQRILDELAEFEALGIRPVEKAQLGLMCGYTNARSGGFTGPLGRLQAAGLISYPRPKHIALTADGLAKSGESGTPQTTAALQERILGKLSGPRANILREVIASYPEAIDKTELGARLGYSNPRSGGYTGPLGSLSRLGLIHYPGPKLVAARPVLFLP